jgi:hypothetical protein
MLVHADGCGGEKAPATTTLLYNVTDDPESEDGDTL